MKSIKSKKKLGIIGGADPAASCLLYQYIIDRCLRLGYCQNGSDFPEIILINYPFSRGLTTQSAHENEQILIGQLQYCVNKLRAHGVDLIALACNTLHGLLDYISMLDVKFVHMVQAVCVQAIQEDNKKKILVFGTQATIAHDIYKHDKILVLKPDDIDQKIVDGVIKNLHAGIVIPTDGQKLQEIAARVYTRSQFDGIILGCTDFSVLHKQYPIMLDIKDRDIVTLDSIDILSGVLVQEIFG